MVNLSDELLNSDISIESLTTPMRAFADGVHALFKSRIERQSPSEKVINCLRKAIVHLPHLHVLSITLARCLVSRLEITSSNDDYIEGVAIVDKLLRFRDTGDRLGPHHNEAGQALVAAALPLAIGFHLIWFSLYGKPE